MAGWTYVACSGPARGPCPRARALERWIASVDPGGRTGGIYNPRRVAGSREWSLHACGRALDWFPSGQERGRWLWDVITRYPDGGAVQLVLYAGRQWGGRAGPRVTSIAKGRNQHTDHLHIETRSCAAQ